MKFKVCGVDCVSDDTTLIAGEVLLMAWRNEALVYKPTNGEGDRWYKLGIGEKVFEWDEPVQLVEGGRYFILGFGSTTTA